jgi:hypothetical protein
MKNTHQLHKWKITLIMKKHYAIIAAASLAIAQTVSAQVTLFSDNFANTATSGDVNINRDLGGGRLGGTLAPGLISSGTAWYNENGNIGGSNNQGGSAQLGNTVVNAGQPTLDGNYLMTSGSGFVGAQTAFDVAALGAAQAAPLTISLDMYVTPGNTGNWGAIGLTAPGLTVDGTYFFLLQTDSGGLQLFGGAAPSGVGVNGLWTFTFSDTAGTGSAFVGNGSKVTIQNNATTLGTVALGQLPSSGLELDLACDIIPVVFDNVSITTVPEPSTFALAAIGVGCLSLVRRHRRA